MAAKRLRNYMKLLHQNMTIRLTLIVDLVMLIRIL